MTSNYRWLLLSGWCNFCQLGSSLATLWIALLLTSMPMLSAVAAGAIEENELALKQTLEQLNALDKWLTKAEQETNQLQTQLREQDKKIAALTKRTRQANSELLKTNKALNESSQQIDELKALRREQSKAVSIHLRAAYRLGGDDFIKQLLNKQSAADLDRLIRYHGYFGAERLNLIEDYKNLLQQLAASETVLNEQKAQRNRHLLELKEQRQEMRSQRKGRAQSISKLAEQKRNKSVQQKTLLADSQRLQTLIQNLVLDSEGFDDSSILDAKGKLPAPLKGLLAHRFGEQRAGGQLSWRGIKIKADLGTPITAIFRGRVVFADWLRGFGLMTIIDHGEGYMTMYGFCDVLSKKTGDWIESGETIGSAGSSGGQDDPGVYFELRQDGKVSNPEKWLKL
jgi:septal ring factor EnvC (AmiA/AmiB activator)